MGSRSKLDSSILLEFFPRWKSARESKSRTQAGEVFSELQSLTGLSKATLHRLFDKWLAGENILNIAERKATRKKTVVSEIELEHRKKVALTISALQKATDVGKNGKPISRQRAIEIALASGHLTEDDVKHHSTIGRWQNQLGISVRQIRQNTRQERSAKHIDYKFANNVWSLDATVWDGYFLNLAKWTFEKRPATLTKNDNHELEYMEKNQLAKVWVYYGVDCFSGLFWAKAYIPTKSEKAKYGGENSEDMLNFLNELFLSKKQIEISEEIYQIFGQGANNIRQMPLEGRPTHILVDNGSPCNTKLRGFLTRLGVVVDTHMPGNPRAKKAESIISASKRAIENSLNLLTRAKIGSIDKLNYFLQASIYNYCQNNGQIQKFMKSALDYPIKSLSLTNLRDALVEHRPRKVNRYGEVSVAWDKRSGKQIYYVGKPGDNISVGTEVHVFRDIEGNVCAQDIGTLKIYKCGLSVKENTTEYGEFNSAPDSEADKLRKVVDIESVRIKRSIDITHIIETPKPIVQFPARSVAMESASIVPPEQFESIDEAKTYIVMATGTGFDQLSEKMRYAIEHSFESIFTATGSIDSGFVLMCVNKIREEQNNLRKKIGG
jgi:hypothetical protein